MDIRSMREHVKDMYPNASWIQRVNQMPDRQVCAIYHKNLESKKKKEQAPWKNHRCGECKLHDDVSGICEWNFSTFETKKGVIKQVNKKCKNGHRACSDFTPKDVENPEYVQMTIFDFIE